MTENLNLNDMHLVRASSLTGFESLLNSFGIKAQPYLQQANLHPSCLDPQNVDQYLPLAKLEVLYSLVEESLGQYDLAARLGSQQQLSPLLGVLGFVMQQSSTVGEALKNLQHYFSFQLQGAFLNLNMDGGYVTESLVVQNALSLPSIRHTAEFALAAGVAIMKSLCGESWTPTYVEFIHKNPDPQRAMKQFYYSEVRFEQERNAIIFPSADLVIPISKTNPQLNRILQGNLELLEAQYSDDISSQVEQLIYQALSSGSCSADKVARFMGLHRRTLHRSLKEVNTSYTELLDKVRKNTAMNILKQTNMNLTNLSTLLCYSEPSAFSRAFKSWFGITPRQWRRNQN